MKQAYLIHGTSTRDDDWFPWLEKAAQPDFAIDRLWLPDPFNPNKDEWQQAIDEQIKPADEITLISHSLGGIAALRYVEQHSIIKANLLLVGVFDKPLPAYPQLDTFMDPQPNYQQITPKIGKATIITAKDDPIAPYQNAIEIAHKLNAKLIVQEHGGHFLSSDGYTEFPLALKELRRISSSH
ncbi:MAG: alpha/beta hydrolase [Limosilactobacillus sp.]|jgi:predicted alpha/beta hydrolase family esterase|uniref:RBBP9/YdeN family alpha/beta hydrolase n=1 Tax=Limosilactobacillus sp. TaxID=2773925 RepID=UPI0025BB97CB|nr:alpha/beta fold hydrolase [Limosilactobacillus sp.]MCI1975473.1 alpha/beta hydrolase [Limosilactobacillus sp.]MCI2031361.1 alpha/beta hydrolase [Limosilactobacillus sp.]